MHVKSNNLTGSTLTGSWSHTLHEIAYRWNERERDREKKRRGGGGVFFCFCHKGFFQCSTQLIMPKPWA